jgi:TolA-binding protein
MAMIESDAIEQALAAALRQDKAPRSGDDEMLRRLVERVAQTPAPAPRRFVNAHTTPVIGAGFVGAAALIAIAMHHATPVAHVSASTPFTAAPIVEAPAVTIAETLIAPAPIEPVKAVSAQPQPTASQLFTRANELRREGHDGEAATTYRALQQRYPSSPEAVASHMTLGRLLLDRRHDPASALGEFDRYLATRVHGELREEALIGRAISLEQLTRDDEEKLAWQALLTEFPGSMYADQARGRLVTLGK